MKNKADCHEAAKVWFFKVLILIDQEHLVILTYLNQADIYY